MYWVPLGHKVNLVPAYMGFSIYQWDKNMNRKVSKQLKVQWRYVKIQLATNGLTHDKYYRKLVERSFIHSSIINCYLHYARHYIFFVDSSLGLWLIYPIFYLKSPCIDLTGISNLTCLTVNLDSLAKSSPAGFPFWMATQSSGYSGQKTKQQQKPLKYHIFIPHSSLSLTCVRFVSKSYWSYY